VSTFILDFASWLLGTAVQVARPLSSELPAATVAVDQVFQVTLTDGRTLLLHIEFQGRRSQVPMPWRMLEYMARLAYTYHLELESVVLYIGRGAGADDTGLYQVHGLAGTPVLAWGYRVIRLWQMLAEALLVTPHVAPLALVGQMQMAHPEATLTAVVTRMRQVADVGQHGHLLTALVALLPEEEPALLGVSLRRCVLWTPLRAAHLAESLVTGHLDPRLPRHTNALAFRIDLPQEIERKIDINPLFRHVAIGKMDRDVLAALSVFRNNLDLVEHVGFIGWLVHRLVAPGR
jgi:hypothetical protein